MRSRLDRAIDKRDDLRAYLDKWGWSFAPSKVRKYERNIAKAEGKVQRLQAKRCGDDTCTEEHP